MATRNLGTLTLDLIAKVGGFTEGMDKAARDADKRGKQIERRIRQTSDIAGKALKTISVGVVAAVAGLAGAVHKLGDAVDSMKQIGDLASGLGVDVGKFSALVEMMDDLGVNAQGTGVLIATLERNLVTAAGGSKTMAQAFKTLGVDIEGTNKPFAVLLEMAEQISKNGLTSQTAAALTRLFGSQAKTLGVLLQQGPEAIKKATQDMLRSGQAFTAKGYKAAVDYYNAVDNIGDSFTALTRKLVVSVAPTLVSLAKTVQDNVDKFSAWLTEGDRISDAAKTTVKWIKAIADNIKLITAGFAALFAISIAPKLIAIAGAVKALNAQLVALAANAGAVGIAFKAALGVVGAALVGWEIGKYLREKFTAVNKFGIALVGGLMNVFSWLQEQFELVVAYIEHGFEVALNWIKKKMASFYSGLADLLQKIPKFGKQLAAPYRDAADSLNSAVSDTSKKFADQIKKIKDTYKKASASRNDIFAAMFADAGKTFPKSGGGGGGGGKTFPKSGGGGGEDAKKRAAELKKLQDKMRADAVAGIKKEIAAEGKRLDAVNAVKDALATQQEQAQKTLKHRLSVIQNNAKYFDDPVEEQARAWRAYAKSMADAADNTKHATDQMSQFAKQAANNMQDAFADFLFDPFKDGIKGMLGGFIDTLRRMAAQKLASKVFDAIGNWGKSNSGSGGFAGMLAGFASSFGGGKATGGPVSSGRLYQVNERRPELLSVGGRDFLMMGAQNGRVDPNPQAVTRTGDTTINVAVQPTSTRRTASQVATAVARKQRLAAARNS